MNDVCFAGVEGFNDQHRNSEKIRIRIGRSASQPGTQSSDYCVRRHRETHALRERRFYELRQTRLPSNGLAHSALIGKEAVLRARQAEMLAQRRPFVVASKQVAAL